MININLSTLRSDDEELIKEGLSLSGCKTIEEFAIEAMLNESARLTQNAMNTELSKDDFDHFIKICQEGAEPNEKLRKAFKRLNDMTK